MPKIILLNVWHDDNIGDSAIAQACILAAMNKWPGAEIEVRTMLSRGDPAYKSWNRHLQPRFPQAQFLPAFYPEPISSGRWSKLSSAFGALAAIYLALGIPSRHRRFVRAGISGALAVVLVGGSDLFEVRRPFTSRFRLRRITEAAIDAARVGVPVYLWGHTIGPFETRTGKKIVARLLEAATQVIVRDELSLQTVHALAPYANAQIAPDFGFDVLPEPLPNQHLSASWGRYVALVPRKPFFDDQNVRTEFLLDQLAEFVQGLLREGEVDTVALVAQVIGPSEVEDDRIVVRKLADKIDDTRVHVVESGLHGPSEFSGFYARAEAVVAVRLHGAILAMTGGTPALAVAYFTGKTSGVMEGLGLSDSWVEFDDCTKENLDKWWRLISREDDRRSVVRAATAKARLELRAKISGTN
jgi:polysaccharide pyruvyl transferase WcaK-like protein